MDSKIMKELLPIDQFDFIGWVPCVTGHLDFGLMSAGLHGTFMPSDGNGVSTKAEVDKNRCNVNFASSGKSGDHHRRVVLQSWVDWKDYPTERDGQARVVVCAEVTKSDNLDERSLKGRLLIYPRKYKTEYPKDNSHLMDDVGDIAIKISEYNEEVSHKKWRIWDSIQVELNQKWEAINHKLKQKNPLGEMRQHVYLVEFYIDCHGFMLLKYRDTGADEDGSGFTGCSADDQYTLVRQAFYYLKYSLHKHKHHSEKVDALTTIVRINKSQYAKTEYKANATKQLIGQLKRELTVIKRSQQESFAIVHDSPIGIIGYFNSLICSSKFKELISEEIAEREHAWLEGTRVSFLAQNEKITANKKAHLSFSQYSLQWLGVLLAIVSLSLLTWINLNKGLWPPGDEKISLLPILMPLKFGSYGFVAFVFSFVISAYVVHRVIRRYCLEMSTHHRDLRKLYLSRPFLKTLKAWLWPIVFSSLLIMSFYYISFFQWVMSIGG